MGKEALFFPPLFFSGKWKKLGKWEEINFPLAFLLFFLFRKKRREKWKGNFLVHFFCFSFWRGRENGLSFQISFLLFYSIKRREVGILKGPLLLFVFSPLSYFLKENKKNFKNKDNFQFLLHQKLLSLCSFFHTQIASEKRENSQFFLCKNHFLFFVSIILTLSSCEEKKYLT